MQITPWAFDGCYRVVPQPFEDARGGFRKVFHEGAFAKAGLATEFREQFYSVSAKGVLRGLHFQTPPCDHAKLVYCMHGEVYDAVVDLRRGSPTYGQSATTTLSHSNGTVLYLASGVAHGFLSQTDQSLVSYCVTTVHSPNHDAGIHWASAGIAWPIDNPILSERDSRFPALDDWQSPFAFQPQIGRRSA